MRNWKTVMLFAGVAVLVLVAVAAQAGPKKATVSGTLVDFSCASKGHGMTGKWVNVSNEHTMPDGNKMPGCGVMCLKSGQPAALHDGKTISAVFACDPKHTLADLAGKEVEVQGWWAVEGQAFVPEKVKAKGGDWQDVVCAEMH